MDRQDPGEKSIQPPEPIGCYKDSVLEHSLQGWGSCLGRGAEDSLKLWLHQTCPPEPCGREERAAIPGLVDRPTLAHTRLLLSSWWICLMNCARATVSGAF